MATSKKEIATTYPLPAYQYVVQGIADGDELRFSEVVGLTIEYNVLSYADGLGWKYAPGIQETTEITLKKGDVKKQKELFEWINSIQYNQVDKKDITISLVGDTNDKKPLISWTLGNTFPIKLEGPTFDAATNAVAIESLTLLVEAISINYG